MALDYGYIRRAPKGADGDHVDVFVGPKLDSDLVVVIDQVNPGGQFDEHKVVIGTDNEKQAVDFYRSCYTKGWKVGPVTTMTVDQFKRWLKSGSKKRPVFSQVSRYAMNLHDLIVERYAQAQSSCGANTGDPGFGQGNTCWKGGQMPKGLERKQRAQEANARDAGGTSFTESLQRAQKESIPEQIRSEMAAAIRQWEVNAQKLKEEQAAKPDPAEHPHHLSRVEDEHHRSDLLDWHMEASKLFTPISQRAAGAEMAGLDPVKAKGEEFARIDQGEIKKHLRKLQNLINGAAQSGVDLRPVIAHNKLIPRELAAKLKPNDQLFHPVEDHEKYSAAALHDVIVEYYARKAKNSPGQLDLFSGKQRRKPDSQLVWRTIRGAHVLIDSKGVIRGGAGGKLTGKKVAEIADEKQKPKKKPEPKATPSDPNDPANLSAEEAAKRRQHWAELGKKQEEDRKTEKPKKGIEESKLDNEDAKEGDQLGLVDGEGKRKEKPKWKQEGAKDDAKQKNLIDGLDADSDQMDMFGGAGTPDDLTLGNDSTPRDTADSPKQKKKLDADYAFARSSDVGNAGEDLKGSARHKRNAWRSLEDAEKSGTAKELVTRAKLLKNEPHSIGMHVHSNPETALAMHMAINTLPPKPGYSSRYAMKGEEIEKKDRADYVDVYRNLKKEAEHLAATEPDHEKALSAFNKKVQSEIHRLRGMEGNDSMARATATDRYNNTANSIVNMQRKLTSNYRDTAIKPQIAKAQKHASETGGDIADIAMDVIEGKSLTSVLGQSKSQKDRFKPADMYVGIAERKGGPNLKPKTANQAVAYLDQQVGMRGIQWGNSVSDEERKHHAVQAAGAMLDLADVTGLPLEAISLDGKLGLAIGARGSGRALAHYEPGSQVINLTRKKGVGSLAHEWGHALDHHMQGFQETYFGAKFQSSMHSDHSETGKAMGALRDAWQSTGYRGRLGKALDAAKIKGKARDYWVSSEEMFARTFERYVQRKLETSDRKNSYLSGIETKAYKSGGLWPTDDEVEKMTPHFDALMDAYRKQHIGQEERSKYSLNDREVILRQFHDVIVDRYKSDSCGASEVKGKHGDCGHYITVDGHALFVVNGKIARGPGSMKGKHVKHVPGKRLKRSKRIASGAKKGERDSPGQLAAFPDSFNRGVTRKPETQQKANLTDAPAAREFKPKSKADAIAANAIGRSDADDVEYFKDLMGDAHQMLSTEARETNDGLMQLLGNFGYANSQIGARQTMAKWARAGDYDKIPRFDEMASSARSNWPHLLEAGLGESDKGGDDEASLYNRIQRGFIKVPAKHDEEVTSLALDMFNRGGGGGDFDYDPSFDPDDEWTDKSDPDFVPFAATFANQVIERYHALAT